MYCTTLYYTVLYCTYIGPRRVLCCYYSISISISISSMLYFIGLLMYLQGLFWLVLLPLNSSEVQPTPTPSTTISTNLYNVHFIPMAGVGKKRRALIGPWWCKGSTRNWHYFHHWPSMPADSRRQWTPSVRKYVTPSTRDWPDGIWRYK